MKSKKFRAGFTLIELVVSLTMAAVVIMAISGVTMYAMSAISSSNIEQGLQIDMNNLARQIADGVYDPVGRSDCGLRAAASYSMGFRWA